MAHGENWTIHISFSTHELDDKNFIVDFGGLRVLAEALDDLFDHTLLLDKDDPDRDLFDQLVKRGRARINYVPSASAEGLSNYVFNLANQLIRATTGNRVWVSQVTVEEDSKNTATFRPA